MGLPPRAGGQTQDNQEANPQKPLGPEFRQGRYCGFREQKSDPQGCELRDQESVHHRHRVYFQVGSPRDGRQEETQQHGRKNGGRSRQEDH